MKTIFCTLIIAICFFACTSSNEETQAKTETSKSENENFTEFLSSFSSNEQFQSSRIDNECLECTITVEGDSTCKKIIPSAWKYVKLLNDNNITTTYDNFGMTMENTSERVFAIERVDGGSGSYYYFKGKEGKWFLVKRVIYL